VDHGRKHIYAFAQVFGNIIYLGAFEATHPADQGKRILTYFVSRI
jgi:hypothetical protein